MPKGGARIGAGRKKGGRNRKTIALAEEIRAKGGGITPLDVMLEAMMAHHAAGNLDAAADRAKDAAPYLHPRLANIDQNVSGALGTYAAKEIPVTEREPLPAKGNSKANGHSAMDAAEGAAARGDPKALGH